MRSSKEDQIKALMVAVFLLGLVGLASTGSIPGLGGPSPLVQDSQTANIEDYHTVARNGEIISAVSSILVVPLWLMVLAAPLLLLWIYRRYGREKTFLVPSVLCNLPRLRKPWLVNMIFRGTPNDFDEAGFYATLLDLHRRKILDIQSEGEGIEIILRDEPRAADDSYEEKLVGFIKNHSENGVFDTKMFSARIASLRASGYYEKSARKALFALRDEMLDLMTGPGEDMDREFHSDYHRQRIMLVIVPLMLMVATGISVVPYEYTNPMIKTCIVAVSFLFLQSLIPAAIAPRTVFSRWRDDLYKEKLEWDAFKAFLGDSTMMQKYAPQDLAIWSEWLAYGTALGVGDSVSRAMKDLNVPVHIDADNLNRFADQFDSSYDLATRHLATKEEDEMRRSMAESQ